VTVRLVYIAGSGRTGSTLLSLLLSRSPNATNVGQVRDLAKAVAADAICTCGDSVASCRFWAPVVAALQLEEEGRGELVNELRKDYVRSEPWKALRDGRDDDVANHPYVEYLRDLYAAVGEAAPGKVLVDSSKTPEVALALSRSAGFDVTVVHLLRDPRAVACSWERKLGERRRTIGFCRMWKQRVGALDGWAATGTTPIVDVRYEVFAARPEETVARIVAATPLEPAPDLFVAPRTAAVSWDDQHLYPPANESVLSRKETRVEIRPATGWRALSNLPLHLTALRHTSPQGLRYCLPAWCPGARSA
jgi:hypothetical protein